MNAHECTACGGRAKYTHRRKVGSLIQRRRLCVDCGHVDKVLVQPEQILSVQPVVCRRTSQPTTIASDGDN
ncbi:hypothetical protein KOR34_24340 [Posidoniimonas corsicana]|uniref:Transcriptional regulator NrdR n=1 Tax=Posidoniimonas corsicana TaxID=1938618 RepID=A0A5C5VIH2_9BACT|nr:hypothetical protein [Posidoniimonas corsicana]TWT37482.1 hypothetical protein KOR34_24340 [Posidoniimonas corsicana]